MPRRQRDEPPAGAAAAAAQPGGWPAAESPRAGTDASQADDLEAASHERVGGDEQSLELAERVRGSGGERKKPKKPKKGRNGGKYKEVDGKKGKNKKDGGSAVKNIVGGFVLVAVVWYSFWSDDCKADADCAGAKRCDLPTHACLVPLAIDCEADTDCDGVMVCDAKTVDGVQMKVCTVPPAVLPQPDYCDDCTRGYFCDREDTRHCLTCPQGKYDHDNEAGTACRACAEGTYAAEGSYDIDECSYEQVADPETECHVYGEAISGCTLCSPGMYDHDQRPATPCLQCAVGTQSGVGAFQCTSCDPHAFTELDHETGCERCPIGKELEAVAWQVHADHSGMANGINDGEDTTRNECVDCPAGKADLDRNASSLCAQCDPGRYAGGGAIDCAPCAEGMYDHDAAPVTPCRRCPQRCRNDETGQEQDVANKASCEALADATGERTHEWVDYYSLAGQTHCTPPAVCAPGMYKVGKVCHNCPAGQFDRDEDPDTPCELCNPGMQSSKNRLRCDFCEGGRADTDSNPATNCTVCPTGHHSFMGGTQCTACPRGQADTDRNAATVCVSCATGQHAEEGGITCTNCTAGTVDEDSDPSTICEPCEVGRYAGAGTAQCEQCSPGWADTDSNPATLCELCRPGTSTCDSQNLCDGKTSCTQCPSGTHTKPDDPGTPCISCQPGQTVNSALNNREQGCTGCSPGMYDHDGEAQTVCLECNTGTFSNHSATECDLCDAGRSDEDMNPATQCELCGEGTYTGIGPSVAGAPDAEGAQGQCCSHAQYLENHADDPSVPESAAEWALLDSHDCSSLHCCRAGTVDNDTDPATPCTQCPPGGYTMPCSTACGHCHQGTADLDGDPATPCDLCVAGMYSIDSGHCLLCDAGRTDHDSDSATPCVDCPSGSFSGRGEYTCHECRPGQFDHDAHDSDVCNPGEYAAGGTGCLLSAATSCVDCEVGQYSGRSEDSCYNCREGKSDHDSDPSTPCHECGLGQYMPERSPGCVANTFFYVDAVMTAEQRMVDGCSGGCKNCPPGWTDLDLGARAALSSLLLSCAPPPPRLLQL